jgi:hypothetical protein
MRSYVFSALTSAFSATLRLTESAPSNRRDAENAEVGAERTTP